MLQLSCGLPSIGKSTLTKSLTEKSTEGAQSIEDAIYECSIDLQGQQNFA